MVQENQENPPGAVEVGEKETYELHIRLPAATKQKLKDAAELAHKLESNGVPLIPKADLVDLMELFITWGMLVLKKKWLDRIGYR